MRLSNLNLIFISLILLSLHACSPCCQDGEHYPEYPYQGLANAFEKAGEDPAFVMGDWPDEAWWGQLEDGQLRYFIEKALANHPSIKIADMKVWLSHAEAKITAADLYPCVKLETDSMRWHVSHTGPFEKAPPQTFPFNYTLTGVLLNFYYEVDWWGKNLSALRAALGEVGASAAETAAARLALTLSVAEAYFRWQTAAIQAKVACGLVENQEASLKLLTQRYKQGLESELALQKKRRDIASAKDEALAAGQELASAKNRLNMLAADGFLDEIDEADVACYVKAPFELPCELPMDLIAHRPEIIAQIWRIEAGSHKIDVARKMFYPNLNLRALVGFQTIHFGKLFKDESRAGIWGPAIHLPIFEGGRLQANLEAATYEYGLAVLQYEDMVLNAVREVLDAIDHISKLNERLHVAQDALDSARQTHKLTLDRLKHNLSSQLDVLAAEREVYYIEQAQASIQGLLEHAYLALIKAIGGGYVKDTLTGDRCG